MARSRRGLLPLLLVLNGAMSLALAWRAAELREQAWYWHLRATAWLELGFTERARPPKPELAEDQPPGAEATE